MKRLLTVIVTVIMLLNGTLALAEATVGEANALRAAESYLESIPFSHDGLIAQLEYEGYSTAEATYAADNCNADWHEQALKSAKNYLASIPFSHSGLIDQLEYDGYSSDEATYAANNCEADWNQQAVLSAKNYLDIMAFSRSGLIEQLEYDGFTHDQAVYGVEQNGYSDGNTESTAKESTTSAKNTENTSSSSADESSAFIQLFVESYDNGDELTSTDFLHFCEGSSENFLDTEYGYQYYAFDYTGEVVPNDSTGGFTTVRGIQLLDSMDEVLERYGYKSVKLYEYDADAFYLSMKENDDSNYKQLENCERYIVYTYDETAQIVFFFNPNAELVLTVFIYGVVYDDAGMLSTLQRGSKGIAVADLQTRLAELGFYNKSIDGDYGNGTVNAVTAFEKANGLEETGIATAELQQLIYTFNLTNVSSATTNENVQPDEEPELPDGLFRSDNAFLREDTLSRYEMYCYIDFGSSINSACYMTETIVPITREKVCDKASDYRFSCSYSYIGDGSFHCEVSYKDPFTHSSESISFDMKFDADKLAISSVSTTEAKGLETIVEGTYSRVK